MLISTAEQPLIAQAEVLSVIRHIDKVNINLKESPCRIEEGKIFFGSSKDNLQPWKSTMEFDREGRFVVPQTGDWGCWERDGRNTLPKISFRVLSKYISRFYVNRCWKLPHHASCRTNSLRNIYSWFKKHNIDNVNLYHATGLGILHSLAKIWLFINSGAIPNKAKNRYFGGGDDGIQVSNCKGQITINQCEFAGLMDDPVNVHVPALKWLKLLTTNS